MFRLSETMTKAMPLAEQRLMLWIDGVGGYLVCLKSEIVIGRSGPGGAADVPLQADVSRRHAKITRVENGYVLEPLNGRVAVGGQLVVAERLLAEGDEIALGESVKLRFSKPHVLSASARLELASGHRTQPFADAVILMAESCVLGPGWRNHVTCREWSSDVVLYRSEERLMFRASDSVEIDGKRAEGRAEVAAGSRIVGGDFSFSLEAV